MVAVVDKCGRSPNHPFVFISHGTGWNEVDTGFTDIFQVPSPLTSTRKWETPEGLRNIDSIRRTFHIHFDVIDA